VLVILVFIHKGWIDILSTMNVSQIKRKGFEGKSIIIEMRERSIDKYYIVFLNGPSCKSRGGMFCFLVSYLGELTRVLSLRA
jgi:hypothetical protein